MGRLMSDGDSILEGDVEEEDLIGSVMTSATKGFASLC